MPNPTHTEDYKPTTEAVSEEEDSTFVMRVKSTSNVHKVAGAICHALKKHSRVQINVLGGGPAQQALKAIAVATGRVALSGNTLTVSVSLVNEKQSNGEDLTITRLTVRSVPI